MKMAVLVRTLAQFTTALQNRDILATWGTGAIIYAVYMNRDVTPHTTEMWSVTP